MDMSVVMSNRANARKRARFPASSMDRPHVLLGVKSTLHDFGTFLVILRELDSSPVYRNREVTIG